MFNIGLIPARGGSKGVLRKNVRKLGGFPLVCYTILAACKSKLLSDIYITTDDDETASVARGMGCKVVHRPKELAQDETPMLPVVKHAIQQIEKESQQSIDAVSLLQPTTPFRSGDDIDRALQKLLDTKADSIIGMVRVFDHHPMRMKRLEDDLLLPYGEEEPQEGYPRQKLPPVYLRNGAIYTFLKILPTEKGTLFGKVSRPYIMPAERSVNIDEELDMLFAEAVLEKHFNSLKDELSKCTMNLK